MAEGPRLSVLLVLFVLNWANSENITRCENTPMKRVICQFGTAKEIADLNTCLCTHVAVPVSLESEKDDETLDLTTAIKSYKRSNAGLKSLAAVPLYAEDVAKKSNQICKEIVDVLAGYDGVQLDLRQSDVSVDKSLVVHFFKELSSEIDNHFRIVITNNYTETVQKSKEVQLVLPPNAALLSKQYDLKKLSKFVDFFIIATHNLIDVSQQAYTYHPSRLMGADDLLNADALVDLVIGLGVDHSSLILSLPSTASKFTLKDPLKNTPRSPAVGFPTTITRQKMCEEMRDGNWTVERDEDFTAPYAFMNTTWMAFDDSVSASIKSKYVLLRDLAGIVVTDVEALDWKSECSNQTRAEPLNEIAKTFTETARKSRAAQFLSLQEQLQRPVDQEFYFNNDINYSPYYIERVVSRDGEVHVIRKDVKTEFECSRQGYFRHPSGCNRFYRCVKFDQQSNYFTVYEFDCPDGLAFDEKVEVCVWPGSLSDGGACQGSSEIAPVPRNQFVCPPVEGYYADPENCRWFFACLDHAKDGYTPLTPYEFRCPFGLVFDERSLKCDWPWKVEACGNSGKSYYGEQPYQPSQHQFNGLQQTSSFLPHGQFSPEQPRLSYGSVDSYITSHQPKLQYATTSAPQFAYSSTEKYVTPSHNQFLYALTGTTPNKPPFLYTSTERYPSSTIKPQFVYDSAKNYVTPNYPQSGYSSTQTYVTPSQPPFAYGSTGSYSTTSELPLYYSSTAGYSSSTAKPQLPHILPVTYASTGKPYPSSYSEPETYVVPNQATFRLNDYSPEHSRTPASYGILYHQTPRTETGPTYPTGGSSGVLLHQQNNFRSIPVNNNYDSHKNDIQYPPIKDFELYSTSEKPLLKLPDVRLYTASQPSAYPSSTSTPFVDSYSVLTNGNNYDSRKDQEQYQTFNNIAASYSTTQRPEAPIYSQPNVYLKPTSRPYVSESYKDSNDGANAQYSSTGAPYVTTPSTISYSDYGVSSTSPKPSEHDNKLYQDQFKSGFNFEDYLSKLSSQSYQPTTPAIDYTPSVGVRGYEESSSTYSTTSKPTIQYYKASAPSSHIFKAISPNSYADDTSRKIEPYFDPSSANHYTPSSPALYTPTTVKPVKFNIADYKLKVPEASVSPDYGPSSPLPSNVDSAYIEELVRKLSVANSPTSEKPLYNAGDYEPNYSFDIDEYLARLVENSEYSTPQVSANVQPLPTAAYVSTSTEPPKTFGQATYSSTTCKPEAAVTVSAPKYQYVPSLESVFSVKPVSYTQRPDPLVGYSSTASNLIDYYHNVHDSLDSAYRAPFPRYYSPSSGNSPYNYSLPRQYEKDAGHVSHGGYPLYPLQPIVVEPVSAELNAEFERYYMAAVRRHLQSEDDGKVSVDGDSNSLLVGKLGAQCDCAKKNKPTVVTTTTRTVIETDDDDDLKAVSVKEVESNTKVILEQVRKPTKVRSCTRPGLFRDPKQCNKFYSCNWDKWTQKYELSEFKCPIHLAFDENLSACNWPSKGPACSHDTLITYAN
ncbi:uncharacterized protein LOC126847482 [Adelges cooleyi]|uniref:uncharacterized protein LOC126847482 n=1 Tax=Adelges cooleyi TaxID=133065 RepID=UPI00217F98B6|nr:uncharacterized protein LOC126847482 [Adelges cooleyi]XP_050443698.1 uncharacterized protein LOC126847482 [Adelges cooleyi]